MAPTPSVYEIYQTVQDRKVVILSDATHEEAIAHVTRHKHTGRTPLHIRNTLTGVVEDVSVQASRKRPSPASAPRRHL
ncbi:MAG: hypothetical protein ACHREM_25110 [Polyangiales bacterium]